LDQILKKKNTLKGFFYQFGPLAPQEIEVLQNMPVLLNSGYKISRILSLKKIDKILEAQTPLIKKYKLKFSKDKGFKIRYGLPRNPIFKGINSLVMSPLPEVGVCPSCEKLVVSVGEEKKHIIPVFCDAKVSDSSIITITEVNNEESLIFYKKFVCGTVNHYTGRISLMGKNNLLNNSELDYFVALAKGREIGLLREYDSLKIIIKEELA